MPLFEYRCDGCSDEFELLVLGKNKPECPHCGSQQLEKVMSVTATPTAQALPIAGGCPPPSAGPCGTGCCRLP